MNQELVRLCIDTIKNPSQVAHFSKGQDPSEAIRKGFFNILGTETPNHKDLRRHKVAIFEIIEEILDQTIINGVNENNFFMQFAEVRNLAFGDTLEFYVPDNSLLVASKLAGNHWDINKQKLEGGASFPIKTNAWGLAVYADLYMFLSRRIDFAGLVAKVAKAMDDAINQEVATSFYAASAYLPTQFKATGSYAEDKLMELVAHVEAASGDTPIVLGTRKALSKVVGAVPVGTYSENMKNQLHGNGTLQVVNGIQLVQLPSVHKANTFDFAYDDSKLLVLPSGNNKPIKLVFEGESQVKEVSDGTQNMDMSLEYKFLTRFGTAVVFNNLYAEYTLS